MGNEDQAKCVRCGACLSVCPVYEVTAHERFSPRGKQDLLGWLLSRGGRLAGCQGLLETLKACLQCHACSAVCPAGVRVDDLVWQARRQTTSHTGLPWWLRGSFRAAASMPGVSSAMMKLPGSSGLLNRVLGLAAQGLDLGEMPEIAPVPALLADDIRSLAGDRERGAVGALFVGCVQNYMFPNVVRGMARWFNNRVFVPSGQVCCGLSAFSSGDVDLAKSLAETNLMAFADTRTDFILTGCASCASMIKKWPLLFEPGDPMRERAEDAARKVVEFTEAVVRFHVVPEKIELLHPGPALLHLPCHQRYDACSREAPLALMEGLYPGMVSMLGECCGHGGAFSLGNPRLSSLIFQKRMEAVREIRPRVLFTTCSGCLLQWRSRLPRDPDMPVVIHPAEALVAD